MPRKRRPTYRDGLTAEEQAEFDELVTAARKRPHQRVTPALWAEFRLQARAAVADWPPLTGEQLVAIRRIFAPDPQALEKPEGAR